MKFSLKIFRSWFVPMMLLAVLSGSCASPLYIPADQHHDQYLIHAEIPADPSIEKYIAPYRAQLDSEMNRVIGTSAVQLTKPGNQSETLLGNFFTDALLEQTRKEHPDIDFAFGTKGGLRIELPKGPITIGHIFELMPFENKLVILELTGDKVQQIAQYIADSRGQPVGGMTMEIQNGQAKNIQIGGQDLQADKVYKLLTYDYLANGGDQMKGLDDPVSRIDLPQKVRETLIDHVSDLTARGEQINTRLDGRVKSRQ